MKAAIYGYGNIGKGVELSLKQNSDMECFGVFTRRALESVKTLTGIPVYSASDVLKYKNEIDVMIICGGSATDLPEMTPDLAKNFNVVDSFDNHANIPVHFENVNKAAMEGEHTAVISGGWDPGMFSLSRLYSSVILPDGKDYTFWGKGVSQGHSDAIRRIKGVKDARQYTIPVPEALEAVRSGKNPELTARQKHTRECFVVAELGADKKKIEEQIKTMPNYFSDYDTTVNFVSEEELKKNHSELPHGGMVIRNGSTGINGEHKHTIEYNLKLDSNPEFTSSVLTALARAAFKMYKMKDFGCKTMFDIPPAFLSPLGKEQILKLL